MLWSPIVLLPSQPPWRLMSGIDPEGNALDGNLILGGGADRFDLSPSGSRTLTLSHDGSDLLTGSITVSSDTPGLRGRAFSRASAKPRR